jgi:Septum formation
MRAGALRLALVALAVVATGCHRGDDDATQAESQNVLDVKPAPEQPVCMEVTEKLPPEVTKLPVIDCGQPHTHEVFATVRSTESVYPGVDALGSFAQVKCLSAFQDFVGISAFDSALSYTWLVPTLKSWNDHKDRDVLCVLARRDGAPLVGSMRGAKV